VAAPCRAIQAEPDLVDEHTNKGNCIAIATDGTRVLGLGDIGPEAGLPAMEGKALLFKYLGGVDAVPLCLNTKDPDEFIRTVPEIWPWDAKAAGATIVATGRSDFPNQVNIALVFPGIFRGTLEVRARTLTDAMALAAAHELARYAEEQGLHGDRILPRLDDGEVVPRVAAAAALQAQEEGVARLARSREQVQQRTARLVREAREATRLLMRAGLIPLESPGSARPEVSSDGSGWSLLSERGAITTSPAKEGSC
jgi:malic enzyme